MRELFFVFLLILPAVAYGEQPPEDPRIGVYRQLLMQANDTIATVGAQVTTLTAQLQAAQAQIAKLKPADVPADAKKP